LYKNVLNFKLIFKLIHLEAYFMNHNFRKTCYAKVKEISPSKSLVNTHPEAFPYLTSICNIIGHLLICQTSTKISMLFERS